MRTTSVVLRRLSPLSWRSMRRESGYDGEFFGKWACAHRKTKRGPGAKAALPRPPLLVYQTAASCASQEVAAASVGKRWPEPDAAVQVAAEGLRLPGLIRSPFAISPAAAKGANKSASRYLPPNERASGPKGGGAEALCRLPLRAAGNNGGLRLKGATAGRCSPQLRSRLYCACYRAPGVYRYGAVSLVQVQAYGVGW